MLILIRSVILILGFLWKDENAVTMIPQQKPQ
jgi:hypothetical protein